MPIPVEIESGVWLLPSPVTTARRSEDPTHWMDSAVTPPHAVRIGLAHGSVRDFGDQADGIIAPTRCSLFASRLSGTGRLARCGLHSSLGRGTRERLRSIASSTIARARLWSCALTALAFAVVNAVPTSRFIWTRRNYQIEAAADLRRVERDVLSWASEPDRLIVRLALRGQAAGRGRGTTRGLEGGPSCTAAAFRVGCIGRSHVVVPIRSSALGVGTELQAAADWLTAIAADVDDPRR